MVDNLLPEHIELPHVLDLAVHLVQLATWMGRGVILKLFFFQHFFPSCLKVMGGVGWVVAHVIILSPQSQLDFLTGFGLVLGLGGLDLGLGLDNF